MIIQDRISGWGESRAGRTIRLYWNLCKLSFQERMEYRWNTLTYSVLVLLPTLISIYLWGSVFNASSNPAANQFITTYYVVAAFLGWRIAFYQWPTLFQIREGRMATALLRPMSYPANTFWFEVGGRAWSTLLTLPIFVGLAIVLGDSFKAPESIANWLLAILAFMIAYVLNFFLTFSLGLVTIWQNQPEGFFALYNAASTAIGGVLVPLALLPAGLGDWLQWLPFAYIYTLPVRIFMGLPPAQIWQGFAVQLAWLALAVLFFRWFWQKALRRYEVFEG